MTEGRRRRLTCGFRTTTKKRTAARNICLWNAYGRTRELRAFKDFRGTIRWGFWNTDEEVPGERRENPHGRLVGLYPSSSSSAFASMRSRVSKPSVNQP